jgi:hypothetical protein
MQGIALGALIGEPAENYADPNLTPRQAVWVKQAIRTVTIAPGMAEDGYACNAFQPNQPATCSLLPHENVTRAVTPVGNYQPWPYLLPALVQRIGTDPASALLWGRIGSAALALFLLLLGVGALLRGGADPIVGAGLLLSCPPMVLFLSSSLNTSGFEVAAGLCSACGIVALSLNPDRARESLPAITVGFCALALSRSFGPVEVAFDTGLTFALLGPTKIREITRQHSRAVGWAASLVGLAVIVNRIWERAYGSRPIVGFHDMGEVIRELGVYAPSWVREQVGLFQFLDTTMPDAAYVAWYLATGCLLAMVLVFGRGIRARVVSIGWTIAAVLIPVALQVFVIRNSEWVVQIRHVLAISATVPLVLGSQIRRPTLPARKLDWTAFGLGAVAVGIHLVGLWANARRSAVGENQPFWIGSQAAWSPPTGWLVVVVLAIFGATALLAALFLMLRRSSGSSLGSPAPSLQSER